MRHAARPKAEPAPANSEPEQSVEEMRRSMLHKLAVLTNKWRKCPERVCRRKRGCASPRMTCLSLPSRPVSPDQRAAGAAILKRMLREKRDTGGAEK